MEALGDFGGFADGIVLIPAIFMKMYSSRMYLQSLFSLLPIKTSKSSKGSRYRMKEECREGGAAPDEITEADADMLAEETERMQLRSNSWLFSLCYSKCLCRKKRRVRLQETAIKQFESNLDIRSIVKTRVDLFILLKALLSEQQLLLFRN